ncbi:MAG: hypothetical protein Q7W16_08150 [Coriobacteriia bacterium]|nr:hypothetical protein [Coriobacteriia bacterium]
MSGSGISPGIGRRAHTFLATGIAAALLVACSGCGLLDADQASYAEEEALLQLQTPASVWWTGNGDYAVLQAVGKDGRLVTTAWNRATGKSSAYAGYRVVGVEPHAPRVWVVPDARVVASSIHGSASPRVIDIAGDGIDTRPDELYVIRLDEDAEPRSDVDARWHAWSGAGIYSVSVEIDINKGGCPSTMRFSETSSSRNAWSAKVPTDVATFEPIGWSPSGLYFAVITAADASATADAVVAWTRACAHAVVASEATPEAQAGKPVDILTPPPPTWRADILVFSAADGSLAKRERVTVPILEPNAGANLAAWSGTDDILLCFQQFEDHPMLGALMPLGLIESLDPFQASSTQPPRFAWFAGSDATQTLVARMADGGGIEGDIWLWRIGEGPGPEDIGPAQGSVTARWSPQGGMLSLAGLRSAPRWTVYLSKTIDGTPRMVFSMDRP